jgi:hypothetical protein
VTQPAPKVSKHREKVPRAHGKEGDRDAREHTGHEQQE